MVKLFVHNLYLLLFERARAKSKQNWMQWLLVARKFKLHKSPSNRYGKCSYLIRKKPTKYSQKYFGRYSGEWRVVDLPEIWWVLEILPWDLGKFLNLCMILDKNSYIWFIVLSKIWKMCPNFEFWATNSWALSFSFFHLEFLSKCQNYCTYFFDSVCKY